MLVLKVDEDLLRALDTKEWGRPLALGTVIREGISTKELMPVQDFMASQESIYHKSWVATPWRILSWGLRQLGLGGGQQGEDKLPVGKLVILSNVEEASLKLLQQTSGRTSRVDRIYSKELFSQSFRNVLGEKHPISQTDLEVLLKFLARDKKVISYDGKTIKLKGGTEIEATAITAEDTTIASLKTLLVDLEGQTASLNKRIEALSNAARDAVTRKNRVAALAALRSKKLAESNLSKQTQVLGQLEEVYTKIGEASDQVELLQIMQDSTKVLRAINKEIGGVERVDDVVDQLKEQMAQVNDVGTIISEAGDGNGAIDESEVDDELEVMEREAAEKRDAADRIIKESKELQEVAETKRRLDLLEEAERNTEKAWMEGAGSEDHFQSKVDDSIRELERISL